MMLTAREREVIELIGKGNPAKVVAATLHISQKTVEIHLENARRKLHASNVAQLMVNAMRQGIIASMVVVSFAGGISNPGSTARVQRGGGNAARHLSRARQNANGRFRNRWGEDLSVIT